MIAGANPMKPGDVLTMGPGEAMPPLCPMVSVHDSAPRGLHFVRQNGIGDILFECGYCGYMAIWRKKTDAFEKPENYYGDWEQPERPGRSEKAPESSATPAEKVEPRRIVKKPVLEADPPRAETVTAPSPSAAPVQVEAEYVTLKEAAMVLGITIPAMLKKVQNAEIKTVAINGAMMVPVSAL